MTFERTHDLGLVRSILTHPKIWPHIIDDFSPAVEDFEPLDNPRIWYILVSDADQLLGLWVFMEISPILWEVHTNLLPEAWGLTAAIAARQMAEWLWAHTNCQRLITSVPAYNRLARRFARFAGMVEYGRNSQSYQHGGKLHDLILMGLSRQEAMPVTLAA